jgi:hypothetical protein
MRGDGMDWLLFRRHPRQIHRPAVLARERGNEVAGAEILALDLRPRADEAAARDQACIGMAVQARVRRPTAMRGRLQTRPDLTNRLGTSGRHDGGAADISGIIRGARTTAASNGGKSASTTS